ncbi:coiled-coil domain-containing protein 85B isoform 2-T2 [Thomomys bottae]
MEAEAGGLEELTDEEMAALGREPRAARPVLLPGLGAPAGAARRAPVAALRDPSLPGRARGSGRLLAEASGAGEPPGGAAAGEPGAEGALPGSGRGVGAPRRRRRRRRGGLGRRADPGARPAPLRAPRSGRRQLQHRQRGQPRSVAPGLLPG